MQQTAHQTEENKTEKAASLFPHKLSNKRTTTLSHIAQNTNLRRDRNTEKPPVISARTWI
jgi:hypothetical protein